MRSILFYLGSDWIDPFSPPKLMRECAKKSGTKCLDRKGDFLKPPAKLTCNARLHDYYVMYRRTFIIYNEHIQPCYVMS